jgi:hypothetical protein
MAAWTTRRQSPHRVYALPAAQLATAQYRSGELPLTASRQPAEICLYLGGAVR